jgi:plastocyanin
MANRFYILFVMVLSFLMSSWAGLGPASAETSAVKGMAEVTYEAFDFGFNGPEVIPGGMISLRVVNKGQDLHHLQLIRLDKGKSVEDFQAAVKKDPENLPPWAELAGGPNAVIPGESSQVTQKLVPGNYLLACFVPNSKGIPHIALGMIKPIAVTAAAVASESAEPASDVTIDASEFRYALSTPIKAGRHTIGFKNSGMQPHEVVVVQLPPGKTIKDFADAFSPGHSGPPPGKPIGGVTGMGKGGHSLFTADFEPGHYGLICFFMDETKHAPHFAMGMMADFNVE